MNGCAISACDRTGTAMSGFSIFLAGFVAVLHAAILALEMFFWNSPAGRSLSGMDETKHAAMTVLAANQGLYNGFIAAGLAWGLFRGNVEMVVFLLGCVAVAGVYGAATVKASIFFVQTAPAVLALAAVWLTR